MFTYSSVKKWFSAFIGLVFFSVSAQLRVVPTAYAQSPSPIYLPIVLRSYPWTSPFGVESNPGRITDPAVRSRASSLGTKWLRLNTLSWRSMQPTQGGAYDWSKAALFEEELRTAAALGMTPMVIADDFPLWATISDTSCGAIREDKFADYAAYLVALINRYKVAPYNVHHWELGNEIDVDPSQVAKNEVFGCWGQISDPYFGGQHYGKMLKVVAPAMRAADPSVTISIGGLLLDSPNTQPPKGKPEKFLEGILLAGAGNSFDIVAFHAYPSYFNIRKDYDRDAGAWTSLGGWTAGKTAFLRDIMSRYGVNKPLWLNESALICSPTVAPCSAEFLQNQADHLIRAFSRAMNLGIRNVTWYTLEGPGWREGSLLDGSQTPRPVYLAYQTMISQVTNSELPPPAITAYGAATEAYRFQRGTRAVDLVWSLDLTADTVSVPTANFIAAYSMFGAPVTGTISGANTQLVVPFSGLYIHRTP